MKKCVYLLFFTILFLLCPPFVSAQGAANPYAITGFKSDITIDKDTSLFVTETLHVNFPYEKHGIYRNIPTSYNANGKTIRAKIDVKNVTSEDLKPYPFDVSRSSGSLQIKIGDADVYVSGKMTYIITYTITNVFQRYEDHDELYWNVTGNEWDTDILDAQAVVHSPYGDIVKVDCFTGKFGSTDKNCTSTSSTNPLTILANETLYQGEGLTIVVGISKENDLVFPGKVQQLANLIRDNWGYGVSVLPVLLFGYMWWKRGRDLKYAGDNVYYKPDSAKIVTKPLFFREHLPMVYSAIQGFSPSELGTIVDERVDVHDIIAEITELARLSYLKIIKTEKKKLIGHDTEYFFIKLKEDTTKLEDYQAYLFEKIFSNTFTNKAVGFPKEYAKEAEKGNVAMLSSMNKEFYKYLSPFRNKLYTHLSEKNIFDGRPDKVKQKWIGVFILVTVFTLFVEGSFLKSTSNFWPLIASGVLMVPTFIFVYSMPRRLPWGYSMYRQTTGLSFYLKKGKWREEIAEKQLFFAEMLPIAISLGVVGKLAKDMEGLGIESPSYLSGMYAGSLASDFNSFESKASSALISTPTGSSSSWSGGSGFSGGSSGGGFGGGGGGSW